MNGSPLNPIAESMVRRGKTYLTRPQLEAAVLAAQGGDKKAEALVIRSSARLVLRFVGKQWQGQGEKDDLFQEGMMGLLRALKTFDATNKRGAQFFTYAAFWIRAYIHRARSRSSTVREPHRHLHPGRFESLDHFEVEAGPGEFDEITRQIVDPGETPEQIAIRREIQRLVRMQMSAVKRNRKEGDILFGRMLSDDNKHIGKTGLRKIGTKYGCSGESIRMTQKKLEKRLTARLKKLAKEAG